MDEASTEKHLDKVESWRRAELLRMFPDMTVDQAEELATGRNRVLLEKAKRLSSDGCPAILAYRILRPLPTGEPERWD